METYNDFSLPKSGPSKLASLFGLTKTENTENPSLIYSAPKQPKTKESPHKSSESSEHSAVKLEIILHKIVRAYKLVEGVYQELGKMGLALLGCKSPSIYQLLLYKTREEVLCKVRVLPSFVFSILENNYASFYSDSQQNFSVLFESSSDLHSFAKQLLLCKANSDSLTAALTQDLNFGESSSSSDADNIEVTYICSKILADDTLSVVEENKIIVNDRDRPPWAVALSAMRVGSEKAVILPGHMSEPWNNIIDRDSKFIVVAKRITSDGPKKSLDVLDESCMDSSNEESNNVSRGNMLKDTLSIRSHKSTLLSRMARMGQATLPLRGAVAADPSDSEEESSPSPKPRTRLKPVTVAEPIATNREPTVRWSPMSHPATSSAALPAQHLALYQPPIQSQFLVQRNDIPGYPSFVSAAASALPSPSDASLSAHFTESRAQATELRINLGKVADKVDLVLSKVNELQTHRQPVSYVSAVDAPSILSSIQSLVSENEALKNKIEGQRRKIDDQNERLYSLLELSQKNIEQNSSKQHSDASFKLAEELQASHYKEKTLTEEILNCKANILALEKQVQALKDSSESQTKEASLADVNLSSLIAEKLEISECLKVATERLLEAEVSLQESENNSEEKSKAIAKIEDEVGKLRAELKEKEIATSQMLQDIEQLRQEQEQQKKMLDLKTREVSNLEVQLAELRRSTHEQQERQDFGTDDVKDLMNLLYRSLLAEFDASQQYSGSDIKQIMASVIRDMTLNFLSLKNKSEKTESNDIMKNHSSSLEIREQRKELNAKTAESLGTSAQQEETEMPTEIINNAVAPSDANNIIDIREPLSSVTSPEEYILEAESLGDVEITSPTSPAVESRGEQSCVDRGTTIETQGILVKESQLKAEDFQVWRSSQPPPPPLFDEDEDNDSDWA